MQNLFMRILINAIAVLVVAKVMPGIEISSALALFLTVIVLAVLNALLKPILIFVTIPVTVLTVGLFLFIINGVILYLTSIIVDGFMISSFFIAIIASILISIVASVINWLAKD